MHHKILFLLLFFLFACNRTYVPKPEGYVRVVYPEKEYLTYKPDAPFHFEYPVYAKIQPNLSRRNDGYWYDLYIPDFKGTVYLSFQGLDHDLDKYIEDARKLVYKHTTRSDGITEIPFIDTAFNKYGILYELAGNVASPVQFFVTDSIRNFLRGSLYFESTPNRDSLNPIIDFVNEDILHLIETLRWN